MKKIEKRNWSRPHLWGNWFRSSLKVCERKKGEGKETKIQKCCWCHQKGPKFWKQLNENKENFFKKFFCWKFIFYLRTQSPWIMKIIRSFVLNKKQPISQTEMTSPLLSSYHLISSTFNPTCNVWSGHFLNQKFVLPRIVISRREEFQRRETTVYLFCSQKSCQCSLLLNCWDS